MSILKKKNVELERENYSKYTPNKVVTVDQYISEGGDKLITDMIIRAYINKGQKVLMIAPTGSGKTHSIVNELKTLSTKIEGFKALFIVPNVMQVKQLAKENTWIGGAFDTTQIYQLKDKYNVIACTWDKVADISKDLIKDYVCILDECHQIYVDSFRVSAISGMINKLAYAKGQLNITATPKYEDFNAYSYILEYKQKKAIKYFYEKKQWSINWTCKQLGISHAAYYKWLHRTIPEQESENTKLAELIKEYDERFGHILGYRRMTSWINHFNHTSYSKNRVHRIMRKLGIHSIIRKKKKKYQSSRPETTAENKLKREFNATKPNEKWATDVTEFKVPETGRKLYLSVILDLYDRFPVAYVISGRNDNKLVFDTYDKALKTNPDAKPIFHSDRGFQYTSRIFQKRLREQGMEQSMSRVGHCIDNGPTEGLWGIIKSEMYYV